MLGTMTAAISPRIRTAPRASALPALLAALLAAALILPAGGSSAPPARSAFDGSAADQQQRQYQQAEDESQPGHQQWGQYQPLPPDARGGGAPYAAEDPYASEGPGAVGHPASAAPLDARGGSTAPYAAEEPRAAAEGSGSGGGRPAHYRGRDNRSDWGHHHDWYHHQQQHQNHHHPSRPWRTRDDVSIPWFSQRIAASPRKLIDADTVALALRMTCEVNRRLHLGTAGAGGRLAIRGGASSPHLHLELEDDDYDGASRARGGGALLPPQRRRPWVDRTVRRPSPEEERSAARRSLTIFHGASPRKARRTTARGRPAVRTGTRRWGPDLRAYLEDVRSALGCSDSPLALALAVIYLDRACSVETDRSSSPHGGRFPPCPYLSPRTVHRLAATALVLACRALRGERDLADPSVTASYARMLGGFGITESGLGIMERWMVGAMGTEGMGVESERLGRFMDAWGATFFGDGDGDGDDCGDGSSEEGSGGGWEEEEEEEEQPPSRGPEEAHAERGQAYPGDWAQQQYQ